MPYHKKSAPGGDECKSRTSLGARSTSTRHTVRHLRKVAGMSPRLAFEAVTVGKLWCCTAEEEARLKIHSHHIRISCWWGLLGRLGDRGQPCSRICGGAQSQVVLVGRGRGTARCRFFSVVSLFPGEWWPPRLGGPQACLVSASLCRANSMTKPLRPSGMLAPHQKPVFPASVATVFYGINSLLSGRMLGSGRAFASGSLAESWFANL